MLFGYFNQYYVKTEIFPRMIGKKIGLTTTIREISDYDDNYTPDAESTQTQIETAKEVIALIEEYLKMKSEE